MKSTLFTLICGCLCLFFVCCRSGGSEKSAINFEEFKNPSKEYRATLFYSLNDSLYPEVLRKQIIEFAEAGVGGVFLHAREGLLTQYFSKEWWEAIDAAVDQCVKSGINPWFYDEYKWPSGYAAGYVPRMSEEYRGHSLVRLPKSEPIPQEEELIGSDENYNYICVTAPLNHEWLNGSCKVDYLNPEAIKAFIDHTYKTYAERNKQKYGGVVKGIFFDEPDIRPTADRKGYREAVSYSPAMRETFRELKGYDIADHFASLFEEVGDYKKVRLDFRQVVGAQYEKTFSGQLGKFCEENRLILTGHFFPEENLGGCRDGIGNLMRQLRNQGMPGIDHLLLRVDGGLNVGKSVSSVANQYGKERRMSEMFGVSGQNMNFEDRKWIANWHTVMGVNFFVEHLALYSMRGERKRDYPPALSYQQPWWKQNKYIEDYMGRLCYLNTVGKFAANTLLLVPLESGYIANKAEMDKLEKDYYSAMENLMNVHCDFDLGDEQIMEEIVTVNGDNLQVGEMEYHTVLIPELLTLRKSTVEKLLTFARQGGRLFVLGNYPRYVDAAENVALLNELKQVAIRIDNTTDKFKQYLEVLPLTHTADAEIYTQKRSTAGGNLYMLTNLSRKKAEQVAITLGKEEKRPVLWNPYTAETFALVPDKDGVIRLQLEPADLLVLTTGELSETAPADKNYVLPVDYEPLLTLKQAWQGHKLDPNALAMDYARFSSDGFNYSEPQPIIAIMKQLSAPKKNRPAYLRFNLAVEDIPNAFALVVEHPEMYRTITVNGQPVGGFGKACYRDVFFKQSANVASLLKKGNNRIDLALDFIAPLPEDTTFSNRYGSELESIYLIGDFAVKARKQDLNVWETSKNRTELFIKKPMHTMNDFVLVREPTTFTGDLAVEGYPFFVGQFVLSNVFTLDEKKEGYAYFLNLPLAEAIVYELIINGHRLTPCVAAPYRWNITDYIVEGRNEVEFTLTNSLRNLLGPLHHLGGELSGVSPMSFLGSGGWPNNRINYKNIDKAKRYKGLKGLMQDDFNVIPFGFIQPVEVCIEKK